LQAPIVKQSCLRIILSTSADAGIHTFSATLKTAGTQSLTAKDSANINVAAGTMAGIKVVPAATSQLQVNRLSSFAIARQQR